MGSVYANIRLSNPLRPDLAPVAVDALVASGAINLCITEAVRRELGFGEAEETRIVELADGRSREVEVVEPVRVFFKNRRTTTVAFGLGNDVLLGAIPRQDMDELIDPRMEQLIVPPDRSNFAFAKIK